MATNREARKRIEREEKIRLKSELVESRRALARASAALKAHRAAVIVERREQSTALRDDLQRIRGGYRGITRQLLLELASRRDAYRTWWREVLAEKQRRKDELIYLRELVAARRKVGPKEVRAAVDLRIRQGAVDRRDLDDAARVKKESLTDRLKQSRRGVRNANVSKKMASRSRPAPVRVRRAERMSEFLDAVESNLPDELVPWYRDHSRVFARRPDESPDSVAERVVEAYEAEPESVERHASERADARVRELLEEAGLYG
jgi:hypothetical protein